MPRNVAIVFEPDYADRLDKLAFHTPVWIVDTTANRAAAQLAWRNAVEWPHITVTLFREPAAEPLLEDWSVLLDQIGFIERAVDVVDVIGSPLTVAAKAALAKHGFEKFEETAAGFRAARSRRGRRDVEAS